MPTFDPESPSAAGGCIDWREIDNRAACWPARWEAGFTGCASSCGTGRKGVEVLEVDAVCGLTAGCRYRKDSTGQRGGANPARLHSRSTTPLRVWPRRGRLALSGRGRCDAEIVLATRRGPGSVAVETSFGHRAALIEFTLLPRRHLHHSGDSARCGLSESDARALGHQRGYELGPALRTPEYFKANTKAWPNSTGWLMKLMFRKDSGEVLGATSYGLSAPT